MNIEATRYWNKADRNWKENMWADMRIRAPQLSNSLQILVPYLFTKSITKYKLKPEVLSKDIITSHIEASRLSRKDAEYMKNFALR